MVLDGSAAPHAEEAPQRILRGPARRRAQPYRLRVKLWGGEVAEFEDPYRFPPLLTDFELHLYGEGTHLRKLRHAGRAPARHARESPASASRCGRPTPRWSRWSATSTIGTPAAIPCACADAGIWEIFLPGLAEGAAYKYFVRSRLHGYQQMKADPYAFCCETPPKSASVVWDLDETPVGRRRLDGERARRRTG